MNNLNLGIICKDDKIINHRSLLKVLLNPFLRYFGFQISTLYNHNTNELGFIRITKCKRTKKMLFKNSWNYDIKDIKILKNRRLI